MSPLLLYISSHKMICVSSLRISKLDAEGQHFQGVDNQEICLIITRPLEDLNVPRKKGADVLQMPFKVMDVNRAESGMATCILHAPLR